MNNSITIFDKKLESNRLYLRRIKASDVDDMYEYTSNPLVSEYLSWFPHSTKLETERFVQQTLKEYDLNVGRYTWGIELKEKNKLVGVISIFDISYISKRVEVSYVLNPNFQGKGLMKEALVCLLDFIFNNLQFKRVQAKCTLFNLPSRKLLERLDMKLEGELKNYWFIKNKYYNVLIFSKIKNDE